MARNTEIKVIGLNELKAAIKRNPRKVSLAAKRFLTQGIKAYNEGILRQPWGLLDSGGGAPVKTGNLRDTHIRTVKGFTATIGPSHDIAPYGVYVHRGTRSMKPRPWLDYVYKDKQSDIERAYRVMLKEIVSDLAR